MPLLGTRSIYTVSINSRSKSVPFTLKLYDARWHEPPMSATSRLSRRIDCSTVANGIQC